MVLVRPALINYWSVKEPLILNCFRLHTVCYHPGTVFLQQDITELHLAFITDCSPDLSPTEKSWHIMKQKYGEGSTEQLSSLNPISKNGKTFPFKKHSKWSCQFSDTSRVFLNEEVMQNFGNFGSVAFLQLYFISWNMLASHSKGFRCRHCLCVCICLLSASRLFWKRGFKYICFNPIHFFFSCSFDPLTPSPVPSALPSISEDMDSAIRERLHNWPMTVKPVPQAAQLANDLW